MAEFPYVGVVQNIGSIHHALSKQGATPAGFHYLTSNIVWMWLLDDVVVVLALCALLYLVVIAVRDRHARDESYDPTIADLDAAEIDTPIGARIPVAWIVVLGGIAIIAASTVIHAPRSSISTEGQARLVCVAFPLYPALYLMARRWQALLIIGIAGSIAAAVLFQMMFNLGYWVT